MAISRRRSRGSCCSRPGSICSTSGWPKSSDQFLREFAAKAVKEVAYHRELASEWTVRLGDGTEESARRMADGLDWCWRFVPELFEVDETARGADRARHRAPTRASFEDEYRSAIGAVLAEAKLEAPADQRPILGGRRGHHSEHLGHLLAVMQFCRAPTPTRPGSADGRAFPRAAGRRDRARDRRGQFDPLRSPARAARDVRASRPASI